MPVSVLPSRVASLAVSGHAWPLALFRKSFSLIRYPESMSPVLLPAALCFLQSQHPPTEFHNPAKPGRRWSTVERLASEHLSAVHDARLRFAATRKNCLRTRSTRTIAPSCTCLRRMPHIARARATRRSQASRGNPGIGDPARTQAPASPRIDGLVWTQSEYRSRSLGPALSNHIPFLDMSLRLPRERSRRGCSGPPECQLQSRSEKPLRYCSDGRREMPRLLLQSSSREA